MITISYFQMALLIWALLGFSTAYQQTVEDSLNYLPRFWRYKTFWKEILILIPVFFFLWPIVWIAILYEAIRHYRTCSQALDNLNSLTDDFTYPPHFIPKDTP